MNPVFGLPSAKFGPVTPQGEVAAVAGADQLGVVRGTLVNLSGAGSSSTPGTTYTWTQLVTGAPTRTEMPAGVNKVTLDGRNQKNASFTLPFFKFPMVNKPLTFELTVTLGGTVKTDVVVITPRTETVTIGVAKHKAGDFRVSGTEHRHRRHHHRAIGDRNGLRKRNGHRRRLGTPPPQRCSPRDQAAAGLRGHRPRRHSRTIHRHGGVTLHTNTI